MSLNHSKALPLTFWNTLMSMFFLNDISPAPQEQPKPSDPNKDKKDQEQQQQQGTPPSKQPS